MLKKITNTNSSIEKMFTNFQRHSFLLIIVIILLPVINCTSDQLQGIEIEQQNRPSTIPNHFYDIFRQGTTNSNFDDDDEQINHLIEHYLKHYPHRRGLAFHAMRGKRSVKTA